MTIRADVRARVIELHLQGMKRDDIKKSIGNISTGSVSNIIEAYKSSGKNGTATIGVVKIQEQSELPASNMATIRNASDIKKVGSPLLMTCHGSGTGQATITTTNSSSNVVTPRGPLSNLLGEDNTNHTSTDEVIPSVTSYSNSPSPVVPVPTSPNPEPFSESKPRDLSIKDLDSQDVLEEESELMGVLSPEEIENSKPKVRDTESIEKAEAETLFTGTNKLAKGPSTPVEERLEQEKIAWEFYGPAWMRILNEIRREKYQRRHELLVIDRRKHKLSEWKKRLEQMQYDLTARETRILESEPFLPLARQLQEMKLALEDALPWIETIREKAEAENVDIRTTAINVAQELRLYRQSGGMQKQIERANQELALINMETIQKQQALTVLIDLLDRGVTESQIVQLINFAGEWNKYWQSSTTNGHGNLQQSNNNPVNGSDNPGSIDGNGYDRNFSINNLIRLNLLKSATTNILNRMETSRTTPR